MPRKKKIKKEPNRIVKQIKKNRKRFEEPFIASESTGNNPVSKFPAKYISEHPMEEKIRMLKNNKF